jgi:hypothetical protein
MLDQSSYEPSSANYEKLRPYLKCGLEVSSAQTSKNTHTSNAVSYWQLSDNELAEIDDALRYFECSFPSVPGDCTDMT